MLRNTLLLFLSTLFCSAVFSQTEKGRFAFSGQTDVSLLFGKSTTVVDSVRGASSDQKSFNANLGIAYFLADNFAVGISGSADYTSTKEANSVYLTQNYSFGIIPALTYFLPSKGKLKVNITGGAGYVWTFTNELDAAGLSLNIAPGISYFANRHISLDLGVQYSYNDLKNKSEFSDTDFRQQALGLLAGLSVYF